MQEKRKHKHCTTKIWDYDVKRDANGVIVTNERGLPIPTNLKVLKMARSGKND